MKTYSALLIFLLLYIHSVGFSQDNTKPTGKISGIIVSKINQKPISSVSVRVIGTDIGTISGRDGKFILENVPTGIVSVRFSSVAYQLYVQTDVVVNSGKPTMLEIELIEKVIEFEETEVRGSFFPKRIESTTSSQTLNFEDIRRTPGAQEDVIRATALLPGVNVTAAGRNDLIVRGGAPYENLFIVDELEIPNINHFGSQGSTGGPLSVINLDFVRNVDFSAGGFSANHGDKLSSKTDISLRNGNEEQFGGKLNLSASQFGLNLEGPISDDGSYLFSARRSYLDLLFKLAGFSFIPEYWDFQSKINYKIDNNNILTFLGIWVLDDVKLNNDELDNRFDNSRIAVPSQRQYSTGLTWKHLFGSGFSLLTVGRTYTKFSTFQNDSNLVEIFRNNSEEGELLLKAEVDFQLGKSTSLVVGNQTKYGLVMDYDVLIPGYIRTDQSGNEQPMDIDTSFNTLKNGTFASLNTAFGHHKFTFGGRMDFYNFTKDNIFLSPRLSYTYVLNENSSFIMSAGRYYQSPSYIWLVDKQNTDLQPMKADQIVLGYAHTPLQDVKVQLEVFYKFYDNYPARVYRPQAVLAPSGFDDISYDIPFGLEPLSMSAEGISRGFELFIQKKLSSIPLYGLFSFTLSESKFTSLDGKQRPSGYDSRIITNLALGYRFNEKWEVSTKFRLATGVPTTPFTSTGQRDFTRYNEGERLPVFHALDLRVDRRWQWNNYSLITYIDIQNIYANKNVSNVRWNPRLGVAEYNESIGILPTIGVSLVF